jgi:hypothetical protein
MGDLKPLGSEKLNGDEKLKRILELTYYKNGSNNTQTTKADYISESTTGIYGIVKEKDGYYVKKGLNESSLDYIGGMFMKNKNRFSSYAEALKRLSLLKGQEEILNEETKYVLKVNKPASSNEASVPAPAPEAVPAPAPEAVPAPEAAPMDAMPPMDASAPEMPADAAAEMPLALPPSDDAEMGDESGDAPESGEDKLKSVQKLTGKLGQKLRDIQDDMESDDIKYIINSVLSAVNLDKLDLEDKEEILGKFEDEEDFAGEDGLDDEMGGEMGDEEIPAEEPQPDAELGEVDGIDALENLVNMEFEEDDDMMMSSPEKEMDTDLPPMELEKEKTRKNKFHVEPGGEEDLYYRQASFDSDFGDDDDEDLFGDSGYGDTFHFDLKEVGDLEDMYSDEIDDINSKIKDPEFYMDDEESSVEGEKSGDSMAKEIDINELTDIINNSVKETLRKHFE